jgi:hypothetical protein
MIGRAGFAVAALVLAACTGGAARPISKLTADRVGGYGRPRVRTCADGNQATMHPRRIDLEVGPLLYPSGSLLALPGNRDNFRASVGNYTGGGGFQFYKDGPYLPEGDTATVSVAPSAARFARLDGGSAKPALDEAVTYVACPQVGTWWVGGFDLIGRTAACVPLRVQIKGELRPRTLVISLFRGRCPTG